MSRLASVLSLSPQALNFLRGEVSNRRRLILLNFFGGVITAFLEITGIGLVFPLLAVIMRPEALDSVPMVRSVLEAWDIKSQKELTLFLAGAIALTMVVKSGYMLAFYKWQAKVVAHWKSDVSRRLMRMYVMSDFRMQLEKTPSEMIRNLGLTGIVFDQYIIALLHVMIYLTVAFGIATLLFVMLPYETIFAVGTMSIAAVTIFFITKKHFVAIGEENKELYRLRQLCLNQSISAIRESKILGKERYFLDGFTDLEHRTFGRQGHYNFLSALPPLILEIVIIIAMLGVVVNVIFITGGGTEGLAIVGLLAVAMFRMMPMAIRAVTNLQLMNFGRPSLELLASELDAYEHRSRESSLRKDDRFDDWTTIELRDVEFTYPDGTRALESVNCKIHRGEFIGITGPSGSGKSTLMLLLLGLIEPTEGVILIDSEPLQGVDSIRRWQNSIGYVPQGLFLIDGSIADNIAFGDENPDLDRVREVVSAAQLGDYLSEQPGGVLESIGEYGSKLSGGEKQRVVIARAFYRRPDLIAFDEATASLDVHAEKALTDYLSRLKSDCTMIAIAHRVSTLMHCDRIIYLESGEMCGFAPFDDLKEISTGFAKTAKLSNL